MNSLRARLTLRVIVGCVLILGAMGLALYWLQRSALTRELDSTVNATLLPLMEFTEYKASGLKMESEGAKLDPFEAPGGADVFTLGDGDGNEVQRSRSLGEARLYAHPGALDTPVFFDAKLDDGRSLRCASIRYVPAKSKKVREQNGPTLQATLTIGRDRAGLDRTLALLRLTLACGIGAALAACIFLIRWSVRGGLLPLDELGVAVASIDATDLARRLQSDGLPGELRPVVERLNELLTRLEASFARERRFSASAAHELRTPLAELRALAEVNLTTPSNAAESEESWRDVLASTLRMESLSASLLALSAAANPATALKPQLIVLSDALQNAWDSRRSRAAERRITLELAPIAQGIRADRALFDIVVGNLLGNAIEHSPDGSTVHVSATDAASSVTLLFRNPAPTLADEDLPRMFERFWKKDAARADGKHHGLGLSLAREICALLHAKLSARWHEGCVEFSLELPRS